MLIKPSFAPTEEQQAIVEESRVGASSVMIPAYAGCSKTTSLALAGEQIKVPALALAFNKKIAKELEPRFGGNFSVKTLNGLGHGAWIRVNPSISRMELDEKKLGKLCSQIPKDRGVDLSSEQWDSLRRLVSGAMQQGLTPQDQGAPLLSDTKENWADIADSLWIEASEFEFLHDLAHQVLEESVALARAGTISFDDQIYCSTVLGGRFPQFPVVFVDEAQDLSPLNHKMLELSLHPSGRLFAVGDEKQAIYSFRGASGDSMDRIRRLRTEWSTLPLTLTFRCPKSVVARQQDHAPGFTAYKTNREGKVTRYEYDDEQRAMGEGWKWKDFLALAPGHPPVILCRNNAPLLSMAFRLIRQGVGVVMLGRDIGKGLVALSKKICPEDKTPADVVSGKVTEWLEHETSLARANKHEEKIAGLTDRAECLRAVLTSTECKDAGTLRQMLDRLFSRESGLVTLSSIHRFKGAEAELVLHLDPWRIPSKWARASATAGDPVPLRQEYNLRYVAETRTKNVLVNANLEDFAG